MQEIFVPVDDLQDVVTKSIDGSKAIILGRLDELQEKIINNLGENTAALDKLSK